MRCAGVEFPFSSLFLLGFIAAMELAAQGFQVLRMGQGVLPEDAIQFRLRERDVLGPRRVLCRLYLNLHEYYANSVSRRLQAQNGIIFRFF
jgi:hypothetical protein